jgi:beta-lactamase class A
MPVTRRTILTAAALLPFVGVPCAGATPPRFTALPNDRLAELESRQGGRLGVAALDTASGRRLDYRADERFALCSTFKFLAAAAVLHRVDRHQEHLDRRIPYTRADLLDYAPVTKAHVDEGGMDLSDLCAAAIEWSDNTAGNLLLRELGGPPAVTRYARSLDDRVTRLDRNEPAVNVVEPGDVLDTTTPAAMLGSMAVLLCGHALSDDARHHLIGWMLNAKVGQKRLPAGLPPDWRIAHKTGSGAHDEANDIAILWPPGRAPILAAAYYAPAPLRTEAREATLGEVGRIIAETL